MLASVAYPDHGDRLIGGIPVDIQHGVDGWILTDMDWNPDSGVAVYEWIQFDANGKYMASACALVKQPYSTGHEGWAELWNAPQSVFGFNR